MHCICLYRYNLTEKNMRRTPACECARSHAWRTLRCAATAIHVPLEYNTPLRRCCCCVYSLCSVRLFNLFCVWCLSVHLRCRLIWCWLFEHHTVYSLIPLTRTMNDKTIHWWPVSLGAVKNSTENRYLHRSYGHFVCHCSNTFCFSVKTKIHPKKKWISRFGDTVIRWDTD